MKIVLPETFDDITLRQFQEYEALKKRTDLNEYEFSRRKLKIFTRMPYRLVERIDQKDFEYCSNMIDEALNQSGVFQNKFKMGGKEFGFIPNFDEMQSKEWFDFCEYETETETLHKLMAILFRPIVVEVKNNGYEIEEYNGTKEYEESMREMPLSIVNGALVFFWNLARELLEHTLKFTKEEQARERKRIDILKNGSGTQRLMNWLKGNRGNTNLLKI